jgi:outer membrane protein assembly factor BamB
MARSHRLLVFAALAVTVAATNGCNGGSSGVTPSSSSTPFESAQSPPSGPFATDDWKTFAHDFQRTGYQPNTSITSANAHELTLRWKTALGTPVYASPLVYAGNIIVVATNGEVYDLSPTTGAVIWKTLLAAPSTQQVLATPTIDGTAVFIGDRQADASGNPAPSYLYALSLQTGALLWRASLNGLTHDSPLVLDGRVYIGTSGGDYCPVNGGVTALSESTGQIVWTWKVNQLYPTNGGGSVWSSIGYDGTHLVFGTGNTCQSPVMTADGFVALNTNGTVAWSYPATANSAIDDDVGSAVAISNGMATGMSKNGSLYHFNPATGQVSWSVPLGAKDQQGGFASPTTDGTTIVVGAGFFCDSTSCPTDVTEGWMKRLTQRQPSNVVGGYNSRFVATDIYGDVMWTKTMTSTIDNYAAMSSGLVYVGLDDVLNILDVQTGNPLWTYTGANRFESGPVVVPSGLYAVDYSGNVYRFTIN